MTSSPDQDKRDERDTAIQVVQPIASIELLKKSMQEFERLKAELLTDDDYQQIGEKRYICRSGFRKIALAFGLSDQILEETRTERADGSFTWRIRARVWARNGRSSEAVGACDSRERKFAHLEHDVYATAHTRAKSRAISDLVGGGALSAEELEGPEKKEPAPSQFKRTETTEQVLREHKLIDTTPSERPGPPKGHLTEAKRASYTPPEWTPDSRHSTVNQRAMISMLCREYHKKFGYDPFKDVLEMNKVPHLEAMTFEMAEATIKWLEGL